MLAISPSITCRAWLRSASRWAAVFPRAGALMAGPHGTLAQAAKPASGKSVYEPATWWIRSKCASRMGRSHGTATTDQVCVTKEPCKLCERALRQTRWHARTPVDGGAAQHPLSLAPGEALVALEVFQAASLFGCQFFLDSGRASPFYGRAAGDCTRFEAAAGVFVFVFLVAEGGRACGQVGGRGGGRTGTGGRAVMRWVDGRAASRK